MRFVGSRHQTTFSINHSTEYAFFRFNFQVSAVHITIVVLTVIAVTSRTNTQTIYSGFISLAVGSLFILKMVYQIEYIPQNVYDVNCTVWNARSNHHFLSRLIPVPFLQKNANTTIGNSTADIGNSTIVVNNPNNNTANWLGFRKLEEGQTLINLLNGYIMYIVALTAYNLILIHQQRKRCVCPLLFLFQSVARLFHFKLKRLLVCFFPSDFWVDDRLFGQKCCFHASHATMRTKIFRILLNISSISHSISSALKWHCWCWWY